MDFSLIPIAALAVGILSFAYGRIWERKKIKREQEKERAYKKAAKDHGLAAQYLRIIVPRSFGSYGVYENVIVDQGLRERVTIYLGKQNTGTLQFDPYQLSQKQSRMLPHDCGRNRSGRNIQGELSRTGQTVAPLVTRG